MESLSPARHARVRRVGAAVAATAVAAWLVASVTGTALAADPVTFGQPTADSSFGKFIEFKQPTTIATSPKRVEILLATPGDLGPTVIPILDVRSGATPLDYRVDLAAGHIVPNTTFSAQWRITDAAGNAWLGPVLRHTYVDDRFKWKTLAGKVVRVHWTEGDDAFGQRALKIGDDAVAAAAKLLGVTESEPMDFFIYADQQSFYDALGPATRENVGGQAHPDIRTLFALITPDEINASWVESVVPHELTHVVFQTAVDNPYHDPPHWLNEGLAVYLSDGYDAGWKATVEAAVQTDSIIPLDGLAGAFPTTSDRFSLAYGESVSAVDRIVRVNGRAALVKLIRSYHDGVSDDEAFNAALGRDVAGFQADWLRELGANPPNRLGPRPAPVGPLPAGWSVPQPNPSFEITGSAPPVVPSSPIPSQGSDPVAAFLRNSLAILGSVVLLVVVILGFRRIVRRTDPTTWAETGDNRLFGRPPTIDPQSAGLDLPAAGQPPVSRLWGTTDWSLPRDPAEADPESPGLPPTQPPTGAPPIDPASGAEPPSIDR